MMSERKLFAVLQHLKKIDLNRQNGATTFSKKAIKIMTFGIVTLSIIDFIVATAGTTLSIMTLCISTECHYA
jgi:hypothetical protein